MPDEVTASDLNAAARNELKTLSKENAEAVARHLAMAAEVIDADPELAHQHAIAASRRAGRIALSARRWRSPRTRWATLLSRSASCAPTGASRAATTRSRSWSTASGASAGPTVRSRSAARWTATSADRPRGSSSRSPCPALGSTSASPSARCSSSTSPSSIPDRAFEWSPALFAARATVLEELGRDDEARAVAPARRGRGAMRSMPPSRARRPRDDQSRSSSRSELEERSRAKRSRSERGRPEPAVGAERARAPTSEEPRTDGAVRPAIASRRRWTASTWSSPISTASSTRVPARSRTRSTASTAPRRPASRYITNNASRTDASVAAHLSELGLATAPDDVVTSPQAAMRLLVERFPPARRCSSSAATVWSSEVEKAGFVVTRSAEDRRPRWCRASRPRSAGRSSPRRRYALKLPEEEGGIPWIATNTDWTIPQARGIAPGNGTLVSAVHTAIGRLAIVAGKPEVPIFEEAVARFGAQHPLFLGDRLDTDILGANRAGIPSALVLTGIDRPEACARRARRLAADVHPRRSARAARAVSRGAAARRRGDGSRCATVRDRRAGRADRRRRATEPIDLLRAGAAAIWATGRAIFGFRVPERCTRIRSTAVSSRRASARHPPYPGGHGRHRRDDDAGDLLSRLEVIEAQPLATRAEAYDALHDTLARRLEAGPAGAPRRPMTPRLDAALAARGLARSRTHAATLIADGLVTVDGRPVVKASTQVGDDARARGRGRRPLRQPRRAQAHRRRSTRSASTSRGRLALDMGASTGGFTQVLRERGAEPVIAVDVGHGQLAASVAARSGCDLDRGLQRPLHDRRVASPRPAASPRPRRSSPATCRSSR